MMGILGAVPAAAATADWRVFRGEGFVGRWVVSADANERQRLMHLEEGV